MKTPNTPLRVTVTYASNAVAHMFLYQLARGDVFGYDQPLVLCLMESSSRLDWARGVAIELEAAAMTLVTEITSTHRYDEAFQQADYIILMSPAVDWTDWPNPFRYLTTHAHIFKDQALAVHLFAPRSCQVVVVGDLSLISATLLCHFSPTFPRENVTCVSRLTETRARCVLAARLRVAVKDVRGPVAWGYAMPGPGQQFVDTRRARVTLPETGREEAVEDVLQDDKWLNKEFQQMCADLDSNSAVMSLSQAMVDHIRDLRMGTPEGGAVGLGVVGDGVYDIPPGLFCCLPVTIRDQKWEHVPTLVVTGCHQVQFRLAVTQLRDELEAAKTLLPHPRPPVVESLPSEPSSLSVLSYVPSEVKISNTSFESPPSTRPVSPPQSVEELGLEEEAMDEVKSIPEIVAPRSPRHSITDDAKTISLDSVSMVEGFKSNESL